MPETVKIDTEFIRLDSLLKLCGESPTGGGAKARILSGQVLLNGRVCLERGKKIRSGDIIGTGDREYRVDGPERENVY